jgi:hypothetical protein
MSQSLSGAPLNLSHLARLLLQSSILIDLCHGKRDAYVFKLPIDKKRWSV